MNNVTSKIRNATYRIFHSSEVFLFFGSKEIQCTSPARIDRAMRENINDVLDFQSKKHVEIFKGLLDHNETCYLAYLNSQCVHRSFVMHGPCKVPVHRFVEMEIEKGEVFIHFCETASGARGHGIFPAVLTRIIRDLRPRRVLLAVDSKNAPSIQGVTKAGFIPLERIKVLIILGIKIVRKQEMGRVDPTVKTRI